MAGRMNRFGATAANLIEVFSTGSYTPTLTELGGQVSIERHLDSAVDKIIQNMPEELFLGLSSVDLELVEQRAVAAQTTATMTLHPVLSGKTHVWVGPPAFFRQKPRLQTDSIDIDNYVDPIRTPMVELAASSFTVNNTTGLITLVGVAMNANDKMFATYEADPASLVLPSLANLAVVGCAATVGAKLYPRQSEQWAFITKLEDDFTNDIKALREGEWLPPEIRLMQFWKEIIPDADSKRSIQVGHLGRG